MGPQWSNGLESSPIKAQPNRNSDFTEEQKFLDRKGRDLKYFLGRISRKLKSLFLNIRPTVKLDYLALAQLMFLSGTARATRSTQIML